MMQRQGALGPDGAPAAPSGQRSAGRASTGAAPERAGLPERATEYLREVRGELQKVAWPGRSEVVNYTIVVLVAVVILTLFVFGLDYFIAKAILELFKK